MVAMPPSRIADRDPSVRISRTVPLLCSRIIRSPADLLRKNAYGRSVRWRTNLVVSCRSRCVRRYSRTWPRTRDTRK